MRVDINNIRDTCPYQGGEPARLACYRKKNDCMQNDCYKRGKVCYGKQSEACNLCLIKCQI